MLNCVVSVEHASNAWPEDVPDPGIDPAVYDSHVAWDPAARPVAEALATALDAPIFLGRYTRLFVDLNRRPDSAACVPAHAFGVDVPGNAELSADARAARIAAAHAPYWGAVTEAVRTRLEPGVLHLSVHSFTEVYQGHVRDVDLGILIDPDHPLEADFSRYLQAALVGSSLDVRENEPYDGRGDALTNVLRHHFPRTRYIGVELEISHRHLGALESIAGLLIPPIREFLRR